MPTPNALPDRDVQRFAHDLAALTGPLPPGRRLGLAVSGGPDSLALLLLAHAALPGRIAVATVDHGLRPEAAAEARMVAGICQDLGAPHAVLAPETPLAPGGNVQERARLLRYRLLKQWAGASGIALIASAHHRDDVAEGFLMRAVHGSGLSGLARMKAIARLPSSNPDSDDHGPRLVRPLLDWSRAELASIIDHAGLEPALDPSNADPRYDRARIRALLAREPALDAAMLARAATYLADADIAVEWMVEQAWRGRADLGHPGEIRIDAGDLPVEIRRRLAARALLAFAATWDGEGLDRMVARLAAGGTATLAGVRASGGPVWRFGIAPPRREHR